MKPVMAVLLGASLATGVPAAEPKLPVDLLEFLGSLDGEDADWQDYLASTDVAKVPKDKPRESPLPPPKAKAP